MNNIFKLDKVAVRLVEEPPLLSKEPLNSPEKAVNAVAEELKQYDREALAIINLYADCKPINMTIASIGQVDGAMACPRDLLKSTILSNAVGIIMVHNHVSGNLTPSHDDVKITEKMKSLCALLGVKLMDHIIVGRENEYYSFHENNIIQNTSQWISKQKESLMINSKESVLKKLESHEDDTSGFKNGKKSVKRDQKIR